DLARGEGATRPAQRGLRRRSCSVFILQPATAVSGVTGGGLSLSAAQSGFGRRAGQYRVRVRQSAPVAGSDRSDPARAGHRAQFPAGVGKFALDSGGESPGGTDCRGFAGTSPGYFRGAELHRVSRTDRPRDWAFSGLHEGSESAVDLLSESGAVG